MIGSSKNNRENYPGKCFLTQEKETWVKFNCGLSANWPSNNWALKVGGQEEYQKLLGEGQSRNSETKLVGRTGK